MKNAFTMIELIFVIVVLGILAGVAIPRIAVTRDDSTVAKMRGDLAAIRSGISLKRGEMQLEGNASWPVLEGTGSGLFDNVLQQDIKNSAQNSRNGWCQTKVSDDAPEYEAYVAGQKTTFKYYRTKDETPAGKKTGTFDCDHAETLCKALAE